MRRGPGGRDDIGEEPPGWGIGSYLLGHGDREPSGGEQADGNDWRDYTGLDGTEPEPNPGDVDRADVGLERGVVDCPRAELEDTEPERPNRQGVQGPQKLCLHQGHLLQDHPFRRRKCLASAETPVVSVPPAAVASRSLDPGFHGPGLHGPG